MTWGGYNGRKALLIKAPQSGVVVPQVGYWNSNPGAQVNVLNAGGAHKGRNGPYCERITERALGDLHFWVANKPGSRCSPEQSFFKYLNPNPHRLHMCVLLPRS